MKIIEINEMRVKQQKLLEEKNTAHQSFHEAHNRIMEDLDEQERIAHDDLIKRIKKHFKGVQITVVVSSTQLKIYVDKETILNYVYGSTKFANISKKLCNKIIAEYEEVYGEIEKDTYLTINMCSGVVTNIAGINRFDWPYTR